MRNTYVERMLHDRPDDPVSGEISLWYRSAQDLHVRTYLDAIMKTVNGKILDFEAIEPIHYQAALVEISGGGAQVELGSRGLRRAPFIFLGLS